MEMKRIAIFTSIVAATVFMSAVPTSKADAHATSPITAAPMPGPQCCQNPPILSPKSGAGHVAEIGGLKTYFSGNSHSKFAILLMSDVYGYEAPKLRMIADKFAAAGFYALVPDFVHGDPFVPDRPERNFTVWLKDHDPLECVGEAKSIIEVLKSKGVTEIGAAGLCFGAKNVVELAKSASIKAATIAHPSLVTLHDIEGVKVPISILAVEHDGACPPELVQAFKVALEHKPELPSKVKIYPGVKHGWTVRYRDDDPVAVKAAMEAHQDMLDWFNEYVK